MTSSEQGTSSEKGSSSEREVVGPQALQVIEAGKTFDSGRSVALPPTSMEVAVGEFVAVTGPSGCGKSTLLHLLAALDRPTSGEILVNGKDLRRLHDLARFRREEVGLVFQLHNLIPQLTALQNVEVALIGTGLTRRQRRERAQGLLADVDLEGRESRQPTRLSGGERQRVAIARALANSPRLLLGDEPTGNLDPGSVDRILDLVRRLRSERSELTVLLVTHDPRVAERADRVIPLRGGRTLQEQVGMTSA